MKHIFVYITSHADQAEKIARHLLEKKLVACANISSDVNSFYWWKGKIENGKEVTIIAKTVDKNFNEIKKEVESMHSYEIPCIAKIPIEFNEKFGKWVDESTE